LYLENYIVFFCIAHSHTIRYIFLLPLHHFLPHSQSILYISVRDRLVIILCCVITLNWCSSLDDNFFLHLFH